MENIVKVPEAPKAPPAKIKVERPATDSAPKEQAVERAPAPEAPAPKKASSNVSLNVDASTDTVYFAIEKDGEVIKEIPSHDQRALREAFAKAVGNMIDEVV
jgi:hypothetical protein